MAKLQSLASVIRRFPGLLTIPYHTYRFFQPKYSVGVVGVVFNEVGQVLLVEHVFHAQHPWGLPGGWIGRNEDPDRAVEREFREELELDVQAEHLLLTERTQPNHLDIAFRCNSAGQIGTLSYELLGYDWFSLDDLPTMYPFQKLAITAAVEQAGVR